MARSNGGKAKAFFRANPSGAFDQYLQDIQKLPLISDAEEERRLARRAQAGDEKAAERLVTANLRFVISYVKKYQGHGLDLSELVAIGNEGLLKAVRKFDPEQGVKFISYAVWWVRQAVLKALAEQTRSVRIPLSQNRLPHPPHGIRNEFDALIGIELLDRLEESFVADGDQLGEIESVALVFLYVRDDETKVGRYQTLGGFFIAALHAPSEATLFSRIFYEWEFLYVLQVLVECSGGG